jgi:hypothetical protein
MDMPPLHIGIDLDNTIVDYDAVFGPVAEEIGLLEPGLAAAGSKDEVKAQLIRLDPSESLWMRLQGQVYGRFIERATPYPGFEPFLRAVRAEGAHISIVSHKTRHGHFDPARIDLWEAARRWLERRGFFAAGGFGLDPADLHFEETRAGKIARIVSIGCQMFIDDLPDVLHHPAFPSDVERIWFACGQAPAAGVGLTAHRNWTEVLDTVRQRL